MFIPTLKFGEEILRTSENVIIKNHFFDAVLTNKRLIFVDKSDGFQNNRQMSLKLESITGCEPVFLNGMPGISLTVEIHKGRHNKLIFKFDQNKGYNSKERSYWTELLDRLILFNVQDQTIPDLQNRQFKMTNSSSQNIAGIGNINCHIGDFDGRTQQALNINICLTQQYSGNAAGSSLPDNSNIITNPTYCFNCGTALFEGVKFCPSCGQNVCLPFENGQRKNISDLKFRNKEINYPKSFYPSHKSSRYPLKNKFREIDPINTMNMDMHGRSFDQTSGRGWLHLKPAGRIVMSICAVVLIIAVFVLAGNYIIPADKKIVDKPPVLQSSSSIKTIESNAKIESNANIPSANSADIWRISVFYPGEWSGTYSVGGNAQQFTSEDGETDVWGSTSLIRLENPSGNIVVSAAKRDGGDYPLDIQIISPAGELTTTSTADTGKNSVTITKEV